MPTQLQAGPRPSRGNYGGSAAIFVDAGWLLASAGRLALGTARRTELRGIFWSALREAAEVQSESARGAD